jgi:ATP-dependent DNA helicase RecG
VLELIEARTERTPIHLLSGQQLFVADLPHIAVREAVVNAIMHRDCQAAGPVQVEHSDTRLSVTSPGDFVLGVTPQNVLTTSSRTRNPTLATALRSLGTSPKQPGSASTACTPP